MSLTVQWLRLYIPLVRGMDSILCWGTKILHATHEAKQNKQPNTVNCLFKGCNLMF